MTKSYFNILKVKTNEKCIIFSLLKYNIYLYPYTFSFDAYNVNNRHNRPLNLRL